MLVRSFESATKGMIALTESLDNTAMNLANVNTTGYKKTELTFKNLYDAKVVENTGTLLCGNTRNIGTLSMGPKSDQIHYDFSPGALQKTDNPLDLAIEGDGFFKVQSPSGDVSYTKNGQFILDSGSFLRTTEGDMVLDTEDRPIQIDFREIGFDDINKITISERGNIEINDRERKTLLEQQIAIYDFQNKETGLFNIGSSKFITRDNDTNPPIRAEKFSIQQGMLEMSNSNVIKEMINTINVTRNYESLQKHVKTSGQMLSQAISTGRLKF
ncbi:flagellar hook basal-body protein [bacterium]|nr:flagellar hook basal-body protein [bacterium]